MQTLANIADYVSEKISSRDITLEQYVTTDSLLQDKRGRERAQNLPPVSCNLTHFKKGDVLVANIRPYLKKIWYADTEGGCSSDVLVFRAKESSNSDFLYAILMADSFYSHAMVGAKGSKMPRGDKDQIMRYKLPILSNVKNIGKMIVDINSKISLNRAINHNLEAMAKQLYDYWFVQFDFPNEEGKPYKSSGGKMVWNEKVKREIPESWEVKPLFEGAEVQYGFPFSTDLFVEEETSIPIVRIRDILEGSISAYSTEEVNEKYCLHKGDIIIGMDGNFHINYWHTDTAFLNQRSVRLRAKNSSTISAIQIFHNVKPYIKAKELNAKGSTVGHLSDKDLKGLYLLAAPLTDNFNPKAVFDIMLNKILANKSELISLAKQRDELLPLLMNGQVSVNYDLSHD